MIPSYSMPTKLSAASLLSNAGTTGTSFASLFSNFLFYFNPYLYNYYFAPPPSRLVTTNVAASQAAALQANASVTSFTVSDTAANVAAAFDALNGDAKLTTIRLTTSGALTLSASQLSADTTAIHKLTSTTQFALSGVTLANAAAAQANASVKSFSIADTVTNVVAASGWVSGDSKLTGISVSDTAANILANLNTLSGYGHLTSLSLAGGTTLAITLSQYTANTILLDRLAVPDRLTVSGGAVANASALQADHHVSFYAISDTKAAVLGALGSLRADTNLTSITLTDSTAVSVGYSLYQSYAGVLDKLVFTDRLMVTGVTAAAAGGIGADMHVAGLTVSDTLAHVGSALTTLEALAKSGALIGINVTDSNQTLSLSAAQYAADKDAIALMSGSFAITQSIKTPLINLIWDASAAKAPAAWKAAVQDAAQYFDNLITSPVTVNITVGYGEAGGTALDSGALGETSVDSSVDLSTAQFKSYLTTATSSTAVQTALANLSANSSTSVYVPSAEAKALGVIAGNGSQVDASVGFAADPNGALFTYDPNNRAVAGKYDFIGVVEHELSHALGRVSFSGATTALDLFRYSSPGHLASSDATSYFSIDGGVTNLDTYSTSSDPGDWASSAGNDSNNAYATPGVANLFSQTDVTQLNVLGYAISTSPPSSATVANLASAVGGLSASSLSFIGTPAALSTGSRVTSASVALAPTAGVEEITGFQYGLDHLTIDLSGTRGFLEAFDTSVGGVHAIALTSSGDLSHGLVLVGMPAVDTAANLMGAHLVVHGTAASVA